MSITYKFEIIAVDEAARCMEVIYTADGYPDMHIGARLPFADEQLEAVISMYAPIGNWLEMSKSVQVPVVGTSGTIGDLDVASEVPHEEVVFMVSDGAIVQNV